MEESLVVSDHVWHRVVQIVQEAMLTGVDCADLLREIRVKVVTTPEEGSQVMLTNGYQRKVIEMHKKLLEEALDLQKNQHVEQSGMGKIIV